MDELQQMEILNQFKTRVADVIQPDHDDHYLLRWLRARSFNLDKSEEMLRNHLVWRKQVGADTILTDFKVPEVLEKYHPGGLHGFDKEGSPIWIENVGYGDVKGLLYSAKKSDIIRFKIYHCELIQKLLKEQHVKLDRHVGGIIIIFDLENYGMKNLWKPAVDVYTEVLAVYEANYPETLKMSIVINAPRIFPLAYSLAKPFLSEDTKRKIRVVGGNCKEYLLKYIDADQLPVRWGGTATDPDGDPSCRSKICPGGTIPKHYYITSDSFDDSHSTEVTVGRGSKEKFKFNVTQPNSLIRWEFRTEDHDIGFGIVREADDSEARDVVLPVKRLNSHMVPEDGTLLCKVTGTYVVIFDNSYSWLTKKKLWYHIDIVTPDNDKSLLTSAQSTDIVNHE